MTLHKKFNKRLKESGMSIEDFSDEVGISCKGIHVLIRMVDGNRHYKITSKQSLDVIARITEFANGH